MDTTGREESGYDGFSSGPLMIAGAMEGAM
jgi:hypothetical protein